MIIADLRLDTSRGNITPLGGVLRGEIEKNLAAHEQTILFVSRRGYNNFVSCRMCGEVITCPHCTVSLTYHRDADSELLKCHYCGYTQTVPDKCPKCGSNVYDSPKGYVCEKTLEKACDFRIGKTILQQPISAEEAAKILTEGKSSELQGFVSNRTKRNFSAYLVLGKDGTVGFEFAQQKSKTSRRKTTAKK